MHLLGVLLDEPATVGGVSRTDFCLIAGLPVTLGLLESDRRFGISGLSNTDSRIRFGLFTGLFGAELASDIFPSKMKIIILLVFENLTRMISETI